MSHNLSSTTEERVTVLNYTIPLVKDDMQGQIYTCIALSGNITDTQTATILANGTHIGIVLIVYESHTVILSVPAGSLLAEAKVSESGQIVSGMSGLTLTCTVSERISGLTSVPSAQWTTVSGTVSGNIVVTETVRNDTKAVTTLSFAPSLLTSHAGQYTCIGSLNSPAADDGIITTSADPISVTVTCELTQLLILCKIHVSSFSFSLSLSLCVRLLSYVYTCSVVMLTVMCTHAHSSCVLCVWVSCIRMLSHSMP